MKPLSPKASALPLSAALAVDLHARALQAAGRDIISFCVGEPDFPTPGAVCRAGIQAIEAGDTKYTNASGTPALRAAASAALLRDYGLTYAPADIVMTTGAKYAVYAAMLAIAGPGDEVILPAPYWTSYDPIITLAGATPVVVECLPEQQWKLRPEQLEAAVTARTKALILNNPNNPTGAVYTRGELSALAAVCREHDLYVVSDEIYSRLLYTQEPFCPAASVDADMFARTVTVNGVSKAYAMTGWRIGYAASAAPGIIRAMSALLSHTTGSPNTAAQAAAEAALLGPQAETEAMRRTLLARRDCMIRGLSRIQRIGYTVPQGAFYVLADVRALLGGACADDGALALALLDGAGVATVPCTAFGAPGYLRLCFTLPEERIAEGMERMRRFFERMGE